MYWSNFGSGEHAYTNGGSHGGPHGGSHGGSHGGQTNCVHVSTDSVYVSLSLLEHWSEKCSGRGRAMAYLD